MMLGGAAQQYRRLYEYAIVAIKRNIFYRPMTFDGKDIRLAGQVDSDGRTLVSELRTEPQAQHLGCFAGGMVAISAKIFQSDDLPLAKKLVEGCLWAYEVMPLGIMPEILHTVPCDSEDHCPWDEKRWHDRVSEAHEGPEDAETKIQQNRLRPGVAKVDDGRYILRLVALYYCSLNAVSSVPSAFGHAAHELARIFRFKTHQPIVDVVYDLHSCEFVSFGGIETEDIVDLTRDHERVVRSFRLSRKDTQRANQKTNYE